MQIEVYCSNDKEKKKQKKNKSKYNNSCGGHCILRTCTFTTGAYFLLLLFCFHIVLR